MNNSERWNEDKLLLEIECQTCGLWHAKFDAYPRLAKCPGRKVIIHRRNENRWIPMVRPEPAYE